MQHPRRFCLGCKRSRTNSNSATSYTHDALGRIASTIQTTSGTSYPFSYGYSLTDQLTSITLPLGTIALPQSPVASPALKHITLRALTAASGITSITNGNGVTATLSWNDRLQPTALSANNPNLSPNQILGLSFYPCQSNATACSSGNNGNLYGQAISAPGLSLAQTYAYDSLNRLTPITESSSSLEQYGYDGSGNRWVSSHSSILPSTVETPTAQAAYSSSVPNRINGWGYDNAGNILNIPMGTQGNRTFAYDGENRQVSANINGTVTAYGYDGNGFRISKTPAGGTTTYYVYDAFGNLAAEYGPEEASPCGTSPCYLTWDHLGSMRMMTDNTGNPQRRYDFLPFGTEIPAGVDGRTTTMGYQSTPDDTNPKFTGQYRDPETSGPGYSLDWFNARYFSGAQGRFQSVDPANAGADPTDPQTWNAYAYVGNNPLSITDPSGMSWWSDLIGIGLEIASIWTGGATGVLGTEILITGNVGGGGGEPWSEQPDLGQGVPNPGQFVFDYSSAEHIGITEDAGGSFGLGWAVAMVDFWPGSQGVDSSHSNWHAMGGSLGRRDTLGSPRTQTCGAAYAGTVAQLADATRRALAGDSSAAALALHTIQDSYASGHQYQNWGGPVFAPFPSISHLIGDWWPGRSLKNAATEGSRRYLQALKGEASMQSPESYLYPRPMSCGQ